nr:MAG TPA: restriction endonuclease [Caudoviricetes sp.]
MGTSWNENLERVCGKCQKAKHKTQFYKIPKTKDYIPVCKMCLKQYFNEIQKNTGNDNVALWASLMAAGVPMMRDVYDTMMSAGDVEGNNMLPTYFTLAEQSNREFVSLADSNMQLNDFVDYGEYDLKPESEDVANVVIDAKTRRRWDKEWGAGYSDVQCQQLDEYFEGYTGDLSDMDVGMMLRYRDLCKAELRKFEGDDDKGQTTKEIVDLMKLLKISDFQRDEKSEDEKFIDKIVWMIEETEPAEEEDEEKYRDVAGYEEMYNEMMRCMRNLLTGTKDFPDIDPENL